MGLLKSLKIRAQKPAVERPSPLTPPPISQLIRGYFIQRQRNRYSFLFLGVLSLHGCQQKAYSITGKKENEQKCYFILQCSCREE